jgi:N utilization substance protein B
MRRDSRERALSLCYEAELRSMSADEVLGDLDVAPEQYAVELFRGVEDNKADLDVLVADHAKRWSVSRMPVVDRSLLRLGTFELVHQRGVPAAVILDEAVTLAKRFSTEDSGRFVNGVLASIAAEIRPASEIRSASDVRSAGSAGSAGSAQKISFGTPKIPDGAQPVPSDDLAVESGADIAGDGNQDPASDVL